MGMQRRGYKVQRGAAGARLWVQGRPAGAWLQSAEGTTGTKLQLRSAGGEPQGRGYVVQGRPAGA